MPRLKHDDPEKVYACPACDTAPMWMRSGNGHTDNHPERPFCCEECGTATYYVVERDRHYNHNARDLSTEQWNTHRERILAEHNLLDAEGVSAD